MDIDIEHIARLARLGLSEEEKALFAKQLGDILHYAENLTKLDLKDIAPTSHAIPMKNVLRDDVAVPCTEIDQILKNGPEVDENMFRVPRIIE